MLNVNTKANKGLSCLCTQAIFQETLPNRQCDFQQSRPPRPEVNHTFMKTHPDSMIFGGGSHVCVLYAAVKILSLQTYISEI